MRLSCCQNWNVRTLRSIVSIVDNVDSRRTYAIPFICERIYGICVCVSTTFPNLQTSKSFLSNFHRSQNSERKLAQAFLYISFIFDVQETFAPYSLSSTRIWQIHTAQWVVCVSVLYIVHCAYLPMCLTLRVQLVFIWNASEGFVFFSFNWHVSCRWWQFYQLNRKEELCMMYVSLGVWLWRRGNRQKCTFVELNWGGLGCERMSLCALGRLENFIQNWIISRLSTYIFPCADWRYATFSILSECC